MTYALSRIIHLIAALLQVLPRAIRLPLALVRPLPLLVRALLVTLLGIRLLPLLALGCVLVALAALVLGLLLLHVVLGCGLLLGILLAAVDSLGLGADDVALGLGITGVRLGGWGRLGGLADFGVGLLLLDAVLVRGLGDVLRVRLLFWAGVEEVADGGQRDGEGCCEPGVVSVRRED